MHEQKEAVGQNSRKRLLIGGIALFVCLVGTAVVSFFAARHFIKKAPQILQTALEEQGITLTFHVDESTSLLGFTLSDLKFSGPSLPVTGKAESFDISLKLKPSVRPLFFEARLAKSFFEKNEKFLESKKQEAAQSPKGMGKMAGLALKLLRASINIEDLSAEQYGVKHLHYTFGISNFSLNSKGLPKITATHFLRVEEVLEYPSIDGAELSGGVTLDLPEIQLTAHKFAAGPFAINFDSTVDTETLAWKLTSSIPKTDLTLKPVGLNKTLLEYLKLKGGTLALNLDLAGNGADTKSIKGTGNIEIVDFTSKVKHAFADGTFTASVNVKFKKEEELEVQGDANINLNDLMFRYESLFYKEQGVPLKLDLHVNGNEKRIQLKPSNLNFHSLNASFSGDFALNPKEMSNLQFKIDPTDLVRWERFFPKQTGNRTSGYFSAMGNFSGTSENWQGGKLNVDFMAQDVQVPFLPEWNRQKGMNLAGTIHMNSKTHVELDNGTIRALETDSQVNLSNIEVTYGEIFKKKAGTRLALDLVVKSSASKAEVKRGLLELDQIKVRANGNVNNFKNPTASLLIDSSPVSLAQILDFLPNIKPKNISQMAGVVALKTKITGALLSPNGPNVDGTLDVRNLSLGYSLEETKKKIVLNNLSGPIGFTNNSLNAQKISFAFPKTKGVGSLKIQDFKTPSVQFDIQSPLFTLSDFYDLPKNASAPAGVVPVPVSNKKPEDDFRKNPFLKGLTLSGSLNIAKADLGHSVLEPLTAKVEFKNMRLKLSPVKMGAFGGTIVSETDWNGVPASPLTKQTLNVQNVNVNPFLSSYSEKVKDVLEGKFFTQMDLSFSGMNAEEIKKTLEGKGSFTLKEGKIKTVRLTKGPLESLKKIPQVGQGITKTDWDEKLNDATGQFALKNGQVNLSNLLIHSPYFDATASQVTLDMNQNINASVLWTPKSNLFSGDAYEMLKDEQGKTSIPLAVSGTLTSPSVAIESGILEDWAKQYVTRRLTAEKDKAAQEAKRRVEEEAKKKVEETLKGKIDQGIGNLFR